MHLKLVVASVLLGVAAVWSFYLLRRIRDWRLGFLIAWFSAAIVLLAVTIRWQFEPASSPMWTGPSELAQLAISGLTIAAVLFIHHAFQHDSVTGLPNRSLLLARIDHLLKRVSRRRDSWVAVLFLDLDRFKVINDSLGHAGGDRLLSAIAKRVGSCIRSSDVIARLSGDEFVIVLDKANEVRAAQVAERIVDRLASPVSVDSQDLFLSGTIGIALFSSGDNRSSADLLRDANLAMSQAKTSGPSSYEFFKVSMRRRAVDQLVLESDLRHAVKRGELVVYYQPIFSLEGGSLAGFEALLRWQHPERGLIGPSEFIPLAEDTGLIVPIGGWVMAEACNQMVDWRRRFHSAKGAVMHVNLSGHQFSQSDLVGQIEEVLERTGLPASSLGLEVTESTVMSDTELTAATMSRLAGLGAQLAIDDFGTGYSSLSYLGRFPISKIKIDRSFVMNMNDDEENSKIVRSVIMLARDLEMEVIAEGIELESHVMQLASLGCQFGQGNYLGAAKERSQAIALLKPGRFKPWPADVTVSRAS